MDVLKLALCQPEIAWKSPEENRLMFDKMFSEAQKGIDVFVLPEMFTTGFIPDPKSLEEKSEHKTLSWMQSMAHRYGAAIAGSCVVEDDGRFFNRFIWVCPNGQYYSYDKRHLFSLGSEHHHYTAGDKNIVFEYRGWKIKPLICYDLRFPVWSRNRFESESFEYDILLVPANWPSGRHFVWQQLLMARAIENQSFCIGVNRSGSDGNGWQYSAGSAVAAPWGEWLTEQKDGNPSIVYAEISHNKLVNYRSQYPFAKDWDEFHVE